MKLLMKRQQKLDPSHSFRFRGHVSTISGILPLVLPFISPPLVSDLASTENLLKKKNTGEKALRSHWCNKLKEDQRGASDIKRVIFMTLVGARSACLLRHMSARPGNVFGMQTVSLQCRWGLQRWTGVRVETPVSPIGCVVRQRSYVGGDDTVFCCWCFGKDRIFLRCAQPPSKDTFNWGNLQNGHWSGSPADSEAFWCDSFY